ncbi:hypothetical protein [Campylobacter aviculae]|uniref:Uncharacterized protein n=1 Tax=Campylobacter aviculae TaxID=2510190 RepID=A0A4U7BN35_9BACT|nr:hypothetical protein [Campylobacter aviculae]TKX31635.1 hypothetical protein CQA76_05820 [Campylobacter aviculae]
MILVTPCGVIDTTNFGKSEVNRQTINLSLKAQDDKDKKVEANKDINQILNAKIKNDLYKSDNLIDISA